MNVCVCALYLSSTTQSRKASIVYPIVMVCMTEKERSLSHFVMLSFCGEVSLLLDSRWPLCFSKPQHNACEICVATLSQTPSSAYFTLCVWVCHIFVQTFPLLSKTVFLRCQWVGTVFLAQNRCPYEVASLQRMRWVTSLFASI